MKTILVAFLALALTPIATDALATRLMYSSLATPSNSDVDYIPFLLIVGGTCLVVAVGKVCIWAAGKVWKGLR